MRTLGEVMGRVSIPVVTPFFDNEDVNLPALEKLIDFLVGKSCSDSLILTGTTGEFYALTDAERVELWEVARDAVAGRVPLVASVGAASTRATLQLAQKAERLGYDVLMVVLPYYSKPTQTGVLRHFQAVAEATSLPILIYNIPLFAGINMEPTTLQRLAAIPNIWGIKEEAGIHPIQATAFALNTPPDFSLYCGDDTMILQVFAQGGVGAVSGGAHVIGPGIQKMIATYLKGDNETARSLYRRMFPFFSALTQNDRTSPVPILRSAIQLVSGIKIGPPRSPQMPATDEETATIAAILENLSDLVYRFTE